MRKYLLRYLVFWLPAFVVMGFVGNRAPFALRWFTACFMVLGWVVNTGMASAQLPRGTLSALLIYFGVSVLLTVGWYGGHLAQYLGGTWGYLLGGAVSFVPLEPFVLALLDFNIPHELYVIGGLCFLCLVSWLVGRLYRHLNPNPYRPRYRSR